MRFVAVGFPTAIFLGGLGQARLAWRGEVMIMQMYLVSWRTTDLMASDDDVVNGIREAIARHKEPDWPTSAQVGDCVINVRNHSVGEAHVEIDGPVPDRYLWGSLDIEVEMELSSSHLLGAVNG